MARALELAAGGLGLTSPNPAVGAVLVRDGRAVGEGFHERAGGPHAEAVALAAAGPDARGATCYVSLEPCSHHGRTPPCADALIAAGVARVVAACADPNPRVDGRGLARLQEAGVEVTVGVGETEARALNRAFFTFVTAKRPHVTLKSAMTLDGKIAAWDGTSRWITGEAARHEAHRLRFLADAILVGIGTVLRDDPELTVRRGDLPAKEPWRVVADSRLRIRRGPGCSRRASPGARSSPARHRPPAGGRPRCESAACGSSSCPRKAGASRCGRSSARSPSSRSWPSWPRAGGSSAQPYWTRAWWTG